MIAMDPQNSAIADGDHEEHTSGQETAKLERKDSQTASEWVNSQLQLEAEAREALPYSFDNCTQPLGSIRQNVFACLTCNPPPSNPRDTFKPAGLCYGCSIACHGEHTLVEIFARRNFTCDCGTTRFPAEQPCTLRINPATGVKGGAHSQPPAEGNDYNHNFQNRFCGCNEWYEAEKQKGTMYQCLGLAADKKGGCGEDWWHPECLLGLPRDWYVKKEDEQVKAENDTQERGDGEEHPVPPGFPQDDDDFEALICYQCVDATPWLRDYADSKGFTTVRHKAQAAAVKSDLREVKSEPREIKPEPSEATLSLSEQPAASLKRSLDSADAREETPSKKTKVEDEAEVAPTPIADVEVKPKHATLPPAPSGTYSILPTEGDFRDHFCRCASCYPRLAAYLPLLEEEETYEPPLSEEGGGDGAGSAGTASLLDRGEAALSNMDRVRAIEGVMVYNHLKDKVKTFLAPFAESGQAVGAEDIKAYFEKLRGDAEAIRAAGSAAATGGGEDETDGGGRKEQSGK